MKIEGVTRLGIAAFAALGWGVVSALHAQVVSFEPITAPPGQVVALTVVYSGEGRGGVAAQFEIALNDAITILAIGSGQPNCQLAPDLARAGTGFAFVPAGCSPEVLGSCTAVRALIFDFFDRTPLPDGPLLRCAAVVAPDAAEGVYPLVIRGFKVADSAGRLLPEARSEDGVLEVRRVLPTPTATASPTATPTPARTPECTGDCNGDGTVTIEEIVRMVAAAQGESPLPCAWADVNRDGAVTIEEILSAVNFALNGC